LKALAIFRRETSPSLVVGIEKNEAILDLRNAIEKELKAAVLHRRTEIFSAYNGCAAWPSNSAQ